MCPQHQASGGGRRVRCGRHSGLHRPPQLVGPRRVGAQRQRGGQCPRLGASVHGGLTRVGSLARGRPRASSDGSRAGAKSPRGRTSPKATSNGSVYGSHAGDGSYGSVRSAPEVRLAASAPFQPGQPVGSAAWRAIFYGDTAYSRPTPLIQHDSKVISSSDRDVEAGDRVPAEDAPRQTAVQRHGRVREDVRAAATS